MIHYREKNQSIETDPDGISSQNFKTNIINMFKIYWVKYTDCPIQQTNK